MRVFRPLLLAACLAAPAAAAVDHTYYTGSATCDGWPRAPITMAPGYCAGIVVAPDGDFAARQIKSPRLILPLPGGSSFLVTDMGNWGARNGKVWRLTLDHGGQVSRPLLTRLRL